MKDNEVAEVALELVRKDARIANLETALESQDRAREEAVRRAEVAEQRANETKGYHVPLSKYQIALDAADEQRAHRYIAEQRAVEAENWAAAWKQVARFYSCDKDSVLNWRALWIVLDCPIAEGGDDEK